MKTTSYEISKQLFEAGFRVKNEGDFYNYTKEGRFYDAAGMFGGIPSYDLETIIEAICQEERMTCTITKREALFRYREVYRDEMSELQELIISVSDLNGESLVDTGAKFLLKLHEKGIINLGDRT